MTAYRALTAVGVTTRNAAELTGVARATAGRDKAAQDAAAVTEVSLRRAVRPVPANRLTDAERDQVLAVLNGAEFVDRTPVQVYATLLDRGEYLCSVSTMYRVLADHAQVADRRGRPAIRPGSGRS